MAPPPEAKGAAPALPQEVARHYRDHGVEGMQEFLAPPTSGGNGDSGRDGDGDGDGDGGAPCRFVRLNPRYSREETLSLLREELGEGGRGGAFPAAVPWLRPAREMAFYALPSSFALSRSGCFRSGRVYGMDVSSGAAVAALLYDNHDAAGAGAASASAGGSARIGGRAEEPLRVLDLCCSPGLKLCAIADCLGGSVGGGGGGGGGASTAVGVDVSEARLALCRNIVAKYHIRERTSGRTAGPEAGTGAGTGAADPVRIRLYRADGCTFGTVGGADPSGALVFDSEVAKEEARAAGKRERMNKSARARQRKRLRTVAALDVAGAPVRGPAGICPPSSAQLPQPSSSDVVFRPFDRVLVDAECSTDGAVRQMKHGLQSRQDYALSGVSKLGCAEELGKLVQLQRRLILSGFRLLKEGGIMVYSTCSLSKEQNEEVVAWLLGRCPDAYIIPVSFAHGPAKDSSMISEGSLPGTVRFRPMMRKDLERSDGRVDDSSFFGGGFWLAKIGKK